MKEEDYYGKYILRDGDLRPERIDSRIWKKYEMSLLYCKYLESQGLLFENYEDARAHYKCLMSAIKRLVDTKGQQNSVPVWRRAFVAASEDGSSNPKDIYIIDESKRFLIKIPKGSNTARRLLLKELDKLPKEKGL